ncbi:MAG TPA: hypothetical protein VFR63_05430 [Gaiellaceae bacterium]|nr:hypothetical protein [Gaiellaceae bacterium]
MRRLVPLLAGALVLAACGGTETETVTVTVSESETVTQTETRTETVTQTETVARPAVVGLPRRVAQTHAALLEAARSGDYEALRPFIPASGFSYTFGAPAQGGPIAYWRRVERQSGERPIEILARMLDLPYTLFGGRYVWPFAYDKQQEELTAYERRLLGDQADAFGAGSGYLGWRAGIERDGTWRFFIAGD